MQFVEHWEIPLKILIMRILPFLLTFQLIICSCTKTCSILSTFRANGNSGLIPWIRVCRKRGMDRQNGLTSLLRRMNSTALSVKIRVVKPSSYETDSSCSRVVPYLDVAYPAAWSASSATITTKSGGPCLSVQALSIKSYARPENI